MIHYLTQSQTFSLHCTHKDWSSPVNYHRRGKKREQLYHRNCSLLVFTLPQDMYSKSAFSTRWHCFIRVCTGSPAFKTPFFCLWASIHTPRRSTEECAKVCLNHEFITFPWLCIVPFLHPCVFLLCVYTVWVSLAHTWGLAGCGFVFLCLFVVVFLVTLYSWTTPFCSSSGGGCQETTMAVPLSPLSITVTSRGGALGAEGEDKR